MEQAQPSGEVDAAAEAVAGLNLEQGPEAGDASRRRGSVRWFNASKGFGFIQPDDAPEEPEGAAQHDLFVHQTSIQAEGFRSLREGEEVEFDVEPGDDGRNKAVNVTGPGGAPPLGAPKRPPQLQQRRGGGPPPLQPPLAALSPAAQQQQQQHQQQMMQGAYGQLLGWPPHMYGPGGGAGSGGGGGFPPGAGTYGGPAAGAMGMYGSPQRPVRGIPGGMRPPLMGGMGGLPGGLPQGGLPPGGMGYPGAAGYPGQQQQQQPGGRSGRYPGGGVADRRPPPGTPGVSSGLQVVVHNLPWTCSWQQLKDAFVEAGVANIDRADVIIDSSGRSRGFGTVSFPTPQDAQAAVERMNNADIGGRAVTVRIDRFA